MADFDDKIWELIRDAVTTCTTGLAAVNNTLTDLRISLSEKFLTKKEDEEADKERSDAIYSFIREAIAVPTTEIKSLSSSVKSQFTAIYWILGVLIVVLAGVLGWIFSIILALKG